MRAGLRRRPVAGVRAGGVRREQPGRGRGRRGAVPEPDRAEGPAVLAGKGPVRRAVHGPHVRGERHGQSHRRHAAKIFVSRLRKPDG